MENKTPDDATQNYFHDVKINFQTVKIYFHDVKINFQTMKIVLDHVVRTFVTRLQNLYSMKKSFIFFVLNANKPIFAKRN